jgi:hypothetical protein
MAAGVLVIAMAYDAGRRGAGLATALFWLGQLILFAAAAVPLLSAREPQLTRTGAVLGFAAAQYVVKNLYSPLRLKFPDELQHEAIATQISSTGSLFPESYSLPIGAHYPGLEAVTVAVEKTTGMSLHLATVLVAGVAHVLLAMGVLVLARSAVHVRPTRGILASPPGLSRTDVPTPHGLTEYLRSVTRWDQIACCAALVYLMNPSSTFFNSMFLYQALALPLILLLLAQASALARGGPHPGRVCVGVVLASFAAVTHHVTAFASLCLLTAVSIGAAAMPSSRGAARRVAVLAFAQFSSSAVWIAIAAPSTVSYLEPPIRGLLDSSPAEGGEAPTAGRPPIPEQLFTLAAAAVPLVLLPLLVRAAWRHNRRGAASMAVGAYVLHCAIVTIRLMGSDGSEIAGRAQAFGWLTTSVAFAATAGFFVLGWSARPGGFGRRCAQVLPIGGAAVGLVVFVGGITSSWPPAWQRLPGRHLVAGFESSVDSHAVAVGEWTASHLPPGNRFAGDFGNLAVIGTTGEQWPLRGGSEIFYRRTFDVRENKIVRQLDIEYLLVDPRLAEQLPVTGTYFADDSMTHESPVPPESLEKFRRMDDVGCVYDDGTLRIYDLRGSRYVQAY